MSSPTVELYIDDRTDWREAIASVSGNKDATTVNINILCAHECDLSFIDASTFNGRNIIVNGNNSIVSLTLSRFSQIMNIIFNNLTFKNNNLSFNSCQNVSFNDCYFIGGKSSPHLLGNLISIIRTNSHNGNIAFDRCTFDQYQPGVLRPIIEILITSQNNESSGGAQSGIVDFQQCHFTNIVGDVIRINIDQSTGAGELIQSSNTIATFDGCLFDSIIGRCFDIQGSNTNRVTITNCTFENINSHFQTLFEMSQSAIDNTSMQVSDIDSTLVHYNDVLVNTLDNTINTFDHPCNSNMMTLTYRTRCGNDIISALITHARYLDIKHNRNSQVNENFFIAFESLETDIKSLQCNLNINDTFIGLELNGNVDTNKQQRIVVFCLSALWFNVIYFKQKVFEASQDLYDTMAQFDAKVDIVVVELMSSNNVKMFSRVLHDPAHSDVVGLTLRRDLNQSDATQGFSNAVFVGRFFSGVQQRIIDPNVGQILTMTINDIKGANMDEEDLCAIIQGRDSRLFLEERIKSAAYTQRMYISESSQGATQSNHSYLVFRKFYYEVIMPGILNKILSVDQEKYYCGEFADDKIRLDFSYCDDRIAKTSNVLDTLMPQFTLDEWQGIQPQQTLVNSVNFNGCVSLDYVDRDNTQKSFTLSADNVNPMMVNLKNEILNVYQNKSKILLLAGFKQSTLSQSTLSQSKWLERLLRYFAVISCKDMTLSMSSNTFQNVFTPLFCTQSNINNNDHQPANISVMSNIIINNDFPCVIKDDYFSNITSQNGVYTQNVQFYKNECYLKERTLDTNIVLNGIDSLTLSVTQLQYVQRTTYISDGEYVTTQGTTTSNLLFAQQRIPLIAAYVYKDDVRGFNAFSTLINYVNAQPTLQPLLDKVTTTNATEAAAQKQLLRCLHLAQLMQSVWDVHSALTQINNDQTAPITPSTQPTTPVNTPDAIFYIYYAKTQVRRLQRDSAITSQDVAGYARFEYQYFKAQTIPQTKFIDANTSFVQLAVKSHDLIGMFINQQPQGDITSDHVLFITHSTHFIKGQSIIYDLTHYDVLQTQQLATNDVQVLIPQYYALQFNPDSTMISNNKLNPQRRDLVQYEFSMTNAAVSDSFFEGQIELSSINNSLGFHVAARSQVIFNLATKQRAHNQSIHNLHAPLPQQRVVVNDFVALDKTQPQPLKTLYIKLDQSLATPAYAKSILNQNPGSISIYMTVTAFSQQENIGAIDDAITSINYERYLPPQVYDSTYSSVDIVKYVLKNDGETSTLVLDGFKIILCIADKSAFNPNNPVLQRMALLSSSLMIIDEHKGFCYNDIELFLYGESQANAESARYNFSGVALESVILNTSINLANVAPQRSMRCTGVITERSAYLRDESISEQNDTNNTHANSARANNDRAMKYFDSIFFYQTAPTQNIQSHALQQQFFNNTTTFDQNSSYTHPRINGIGTLTPLWLSQNQVITIGSGATVNPYYAYYKLPQNDMMHILSPQSTCLAGGSYFSAASQEFFTVEDNAFIVQDCGYFAIEQSYLYSRTFVKMFAGCLTNVIDGALAAATQVNPCADQEQDFVAMNCGNNQIVSVAAVAERDLTNATKYDYCQTLQISVDDVTKCKAMLSDRESDYLYSWAVATSDNSWQASTRIPSQLKVDLVIKLICSRKCKIMCVANASAQHANTDAVFTEVIYPSKYSQTVNIPCGFDYLAHDGKGMAHLKIYVTRLQPLDDTISSDFQFQNEMMPAVNLDTANPNETCRHKVGAIMARQESDINVKEISVLTKDEKAIQITQYGNNVNSTTNASSILIDYGLEAVRPFNTKSLRFNDVNSTGEDISILLRIKTNGACDDSRNSYTLKNMQIRLPSIIARNNISAYDINVDFNMSTQLLDSQITLQQYLTDLSGRYALATHASDALHWDLQNLSLGRLMKIFAQEGLIISNRRMLHGVIDATRNTTHIQDLLIDTANTNMQTTQLIIAAACSGTQALNYDNISSSRNVLFIQQAPYASHRSSAQAKILCFFSCGDQHIFPFDKILFSFFNDTRLCSNQILHMEDEYSSPPAAGALFNGISPVMSGFSLMNTSFIYNSIQHKYNNLRNIIINAIASQGAQAKIETQEILLCGMGRITFNATPPQIQSLIIPQASAQPQIAYDSSLMNYMFGVEEQQDMNWVFSSLRSQSVIGRAFNVDATISFEPMIQDLSLDNWVTDVTSAPAVTNTIQYFNIAQPSPLSWDTIESYFPYQQLNNTRYHIPQARHTTFLQKLNADNTIKDKIIQMRLQQCDDRQGFIDSDIVKILAVTNMKAQTFINATFVVDDQHASITFKDCVLINCQIICLDSINSSQVVKSYAKITFDSCLILFENRQDVLTRPYTGLTDQQIQQQGALADNQSYSLINFYSPGQVESYVVCIVDCILYDLTYGDRVRGISAQLNASGTGAPLMLDTPLYYAKPCSIVNYLPAPSSNKGESKQIHSINSKYRIIVDNCYLRDFCIACPIKQHLYSFIQYLPPLAGQTSSQEAQQQRYGQCMTLINQCFIQNFQSSFLEQFALDGQFIPLRVQDSIIINPMGRTKAIDPTNSGTGYTDAIFNVTNTTLSIVLNPYQSPNAITGNKYQRAHTVSIISFSGQDSTSSVLTAQGMTNADTTIQPTVDLDMAGVFNENSLFKINVYGALYQNRKNFLFAQRIKDEDVNMTFNTDYAFQIKTVGTDRTIGDTLSSVNDTFSFGAQMHFVQIITEQGPKNFFMSYPQTTGANVVNANVVVPLISPKNSSFVQNQQEDATTYYPTNDTRVKTILANDSMTQLPIKSQNVFVYDTIPYPVSSLYNQGAYTGADTFTNEENFFVGNITNNQVYYSRYSNTAVKVFTLEVTIVNNIIQNGQEYYDLLSSAFSYTEYSGLKSRVKLMANSILINDFIVDNLRDNKFVFTDGKRFYQLSIENVVCDSASDFILYSPQTVLTQNNTITKVLPFSVFRASFKGQSPSDTTSGAYRQMTLHRVSLSAKIRIRGQTTSNVEAQTIGLPKHYIKGQITRVMKDDDIDHQCINVQLQTLFSKQQVPSVMSPYNDEIFNLGKTYVVQLRANMGYIHQLVPCSLPYSSIIHTCTTQDQVITNLKIASRQVDFRLAQIVTFNGVIIMQNDKHASRCVRFLGIDASTDIDDDIKQGNGTLNINSDTLFNVSFIENLALIDSSDGVYEFYNCYFRGTLYIKVNGARFVNCVFDGLTVRSDMTQIEQVHGTSFGAFVQVRNNCIIQSSIFSTMVNNIFASTFSGCAQLEISDSTFRDVEGIISIVECTILKNNTFVRCSAIYNPYDIFMGDFRLDTEDVWNGMVTHNDAKNNVSSRGNIVHGSYQLQVQSNNFYELHAPGEDNHGHIIESLITNEVVKSVTGINGNVLTGAIFQTPTEYLVFKISSKIAIAYDTSYAVGFRIRDSQDNVLIDQVLTGAVDENKDLYIVMPSIGYNTQQIIDECVSQEVAPPNAQFIFFDAQAALLSIGSIDIIVIKRNSLNKQSLDRCMIRRQGQLIEDLIVGSETIGTFDLFANSTSTSYEYMRALYKNRQYRFVDLRSVSYASVLDYSVGFKVSVASIDNPLDQNIVVYDAGHSQALYAQMFQQFGTVGSNGVVDAGVIQITDAQRSSMIGKKIVTFVTQNYLDYTGDAASTDEIFIVVQGVGQSQFLQLGVNIEKLITDQGVGAITINQYDYILTKVQILVKQQSLQNQTISWKIVNKPIKNENDVSSKNVLFVVSNSDPRIQRLAIFQESQFLQQSTQILAVYQRNWDVQNLSTYNILASKLFVQARVAVDVQSLLVGVYSEDSSITEQNIVVEYSQIYHGGVNDEFDGTQWKRFTHSHNQSSQTDASYRQPAFACLDTVTPKLALTSRFNYNTVFSDYNITQLNIVQVTDAPDVKIKLLKTEQAYCVKNQYSHTLAKYATHGKCRVSVYQNEDTKSEIEQCLFGIKVPQIHLEERPLSAGESGLGFIEKHKYEISCFNTSGKLAANEFYIRVKNEIFNDITVNDVTVNVNDNNVNIVKTIQGSVLWASVMRVDDTRPKNVLNVVISVN